MLVHSFLWTFLPIMSLLVHLDLVQMLNLCRTNFDEKFCSNQCKIRKKKNVPRTTTWLANFEDFYTIIVINDNRISRKSRSPIIKQKMQFMKADSNGVWSEGNISNRLANKNLALTLNTIMDPIVNVGPLGHYMGNGPALTPIPSLPFCQPLAIRTWHFNVTHVPHVLLKIRTAH